MAYLSGKSINGVKKRNVIDKIETTGNTIKSIFMRGWFISLKNPLSKRAYDV